MHVGKAHGVVQEVAYNIPQIQTKLILPSHLSPERGNGILHETKRYSQITDDV